MLYGANPTPEREELMVFPRPALRYPYVVFAHRDSPVQTLGDLDGKRVGFIANDFVSRQLPLEYHNIAYAAEHYADQERGLKALAAKRYRASSPRGRRRARVFDEVSRTGGCCRTQGHHLGHDLCCSLGNRDSWSHH